MRATKTFDNIEVQNKIAVNTTELQSLLSCGRDSAVQIGEQAGARVQIGKRVFWNVDKVRQYVSSISV